MMFDMQDEAGRAALRQVVLKADPEADALPLILVDEGEFTELHDRVARLARSLGLKGRELDEAISGCARAITAALQRQRAMDEERRACLHVVESGLAGG